MSAFAKPCLCELAESPPPLGLNTIELVLATAADAAAGTGGVALELVKGKCAAAVTAHLGSLWFTHGAHGS